MNDQQRNTAKSVNNATSWLLDIFDSDLPAPAKLIASYLRTHMNDYQEIAFPSVGRIAAKTSQSERTIQNHLGTLCTTGWLFNQGPHPKYGTNQYIITTPAADAPPRISFQIPPQEVHPNKPISKPITTTTTTTIRPTVEEVAEYVKTRTIQIDPQTFVDYYTANGWKVGRNPMKDWKAAVRTWEKKEKPNATKRNNDNSRKLSGAERTRLARQRAYERRDIT